MNDNDIARRFKVARNHFDKHKTNMNAAALMRAGLNAIEADVIDDEEMECVVFDVIFYLEGDQ